MYGNIPFNICYIIIIHLLISSSTPWRRRRGISSFMFGARGSRAGTRRRRGARLDGATEPARGAPPRAHVARVHGDATEPRGAPRAHVARIHRTARRRPPSTTRRRTARRRPPYSTRRPRKFPWRQQHKHSDARRQPLSQYETT